MPLLLQEESLKAESTVYSYSYRWPYAAASPAPPAYADHMTRDGF